MEDITNKFGSSNIKFDNKYIVAAVSLFLTLYTYVYAPKLPEFLLKLLDNILVKILFMFLILYVNFKAEPAVSLIVAISIAVLILVINLLKQDREHLSHITGMSYNGIPAYTYSICSNSGNSCKGKTKDGKSGKKSKKDNDVDGPISRVSDAEMESLCMHLKKDKNATDEIMSESMFSELQNAQSACNFASHQYKMDLPDVKCAGAASANEPLFSELASFPSQ